MKKVERVFDDASSRTISRGDREIVARRMVTEQNPVSARHTNLCAPHISRPPGADLEEDNPSGISNFKIILINF